MAKVFISYSRKDSDFAKRLTAELQKCDLDFWIDWEGIPPTVDWWKEIEKGIEEADVFLFLISPDSAKSKICGQEIDTAVKNGKRIIPIVVREIQWEDTHPQLGHLNYIFFTRGDEFDTAIEKLITAIQTDYEWAATHRRLQVKALEWERNRKDSGFLLHGADLLDAESDLAINTSKDPHPTDLQREYVLQSRKATDRQRRLLTSVSIAGVIALAALAAFGFYQAGVANNNLVAAKIAQANAQNQQIAAINNQAAAIANEKEAEKQARISRVGELAAQAVSLHDKNFQLSLLLGIEAFKGTEGLFDSVQAKSILLENAKANPQLKQFLPTQTAIYDIASSPDGKTFAVRGDDGVITLWDVATRSPLGQPFKGPTNSVRSLEFSPDGKILALGSYDSQIMLWNIQTREPIEYLTGHAWTVQSLAFSPDGKTLAAGGESQNMILWDVETKKSIGELLKAKLDSLDSVDVIRFHPDGNMDVETIKPIGELLKTRLDSLDSVNFIGFHPDGNMLVSADLRGNIMLWDVRTQELVNQLFTPPLASIDLSPDGKIIALGLNDDPIIFLDMETLKPIGKPLIGHAGNVGSLAFSPDGKLLASGSDDKTIILWDVNAQEPVYSEALQGHLGPINSLTFSPDGKTLASGSDDKSIILWDVEPGTPLSEPITEQMDFGFSEFIVTSPDGKIVTSIGDNNAIILLSVETQKPIGQPLTGHNGYVTSVAFSPNGKLLASGSGDTTVILWNVETQKLIKQIIIGEDAGPVSKVAFSPDGKTLAVGDDIGTITLWNTRTQASAGNPLTGHESGISSLDFSSNGKILVSGSYDHTIILWDIDAERLFGQLFTGYEDSLLNVEISHDDKTLVSGWQEFPRTLWDIDPDSWINKSCQRAGRNLSRAEWAAFFPNDKYRKTCEQWPLEESPIQAQLP